MKPTPSKQEKDAANIAKMALKFFLSFLFILLTNGQHVCFSPDENLSFATRISSTQPGISVGHDRQHHSCECPCHQPPFLQAEAVPSIAIQTPVSPRGEASCGYLSNHFASIFKPPRV